MRISWRKIPSGVTKQSAAPFRTRRPSGCTNYGDSKCGEKDDWYNGSSTLFHHPRVMVLQQQQPTQLLVLTGACDGGNGGDEDDNQNSKARFVDRDWMLLDTLAFQLDVAASVNADADDKLDEMLTNFMDEVRGSAQDACPELLEIRLDEPVEV